MSLKKLIQQSCDIISYLCLDIQHSNKNILQHVKKNLPPFKIYEDLRMFLKQGSDMEFTYMRGSSKIYSELKYNIYSRIYKHRPHPPGLNKFSLFTLYFVELPMYMGLYIKLKSSMNVLGLGRKQEMIFVDIHNPLEMGMGILFYSM